MPRWSASFTRKPTLRKLYLAMKRSIGSSELYLADLDALAGIQPDLDLYQDLLDEGAELWLDAGLRTAQDCESMLRLDVPRVILGLESLEGVQELRCAASLAEADRLVFSLDLRAGKVMRSASSDWPDDDPLAIASLAIEAGIRRLIVLDVGRVGMGQGVGTLDLLAAIKSHAPEVELVAGGGISCWQELHDLEAIGVSAALVGSALHDGRLLIPGGDIPQATP